MDEKKAQGDLEFWAILELFGHQRIAGYVKSVPLGGDCMLRVDVPEIKYQQCSYSRADKPITEIIIPGFTKFYSPKSVFSMTPATEEVCRAAMQNFRIEPVQAFTGLPALPAPMPSDDMSGEYSEFVETLDNE